MIEDSIEEKVDEYFGDRDGLKVREEVVQRLSAQRKAQMPRIPMENVISKYVIKLKE